MRKVALRVDVTEAAGLGQPQHIAGTAFLPDALIEGRPVVIFASPGGGYSQGYFDIHFEGLEGYSEAEHHTGRGLVFVAMDHLGVGASSIDRISDLRVELMADANASFVRQVMAKLTAGTLMEGFAPLADPFVVGMGQSLGAGLTIVMQGRHGTFDAIIALGKSALHTSLPQPTPEKFQAVRQNTLRFSRQTPNAELSAPHPGLEIPDFAYAFHWETEAAPLVKADMAGGYRPRKSSPPWGSLTHPGGIHGMMSPGFLTPDAARVTVPVLMGYGERDVSADMRREPTAFISSGDISVFIVPRMAHMHNFAETRAMLWRRVADWSLMQSRREA